MMIRVTLIVLCGLHDGRNASRVLAEKLEGKRPLERTRHSYVENTCIRIGSQERGWDGVYWVDLYQCFSNFFPWRNP